MPTNPKDDALLDLRASLQVALNRGTQAISSVTTCADPPATPDPRTGSTVIPRQPTTPPSHGASDYLVGPLIARGGMGAVFSVRDLNVQREVAMKVALQPARKSQRRNDSTLRFIHEAQITGQLEHPNIVPVHQLGADAEGNVFYTMKMVRGDTLHDVLQRLRRKDKETTARYPLARLLTIFQKVCDAVAFAHSRDVIHRDLKPENIMIGDYGEVLLMDWGVARPLDRIASSVTRSVVLTRSGVINLKDEYKSESPQTTAVLTEASALHTMAGTILGTPTYMAPEQAEGDPAAIDQRADVYALGGILYNILTLDVPIPEENVNVLLVKKTKGEILPPEHFSADSPQRTKVEKQRWLPLPVHCPGQRVPPSLAAVAMHALRPRPEDRYQSVKELQRDIEAWQGGYATSAENANILKHLVLLLKRHSRETAIAGVALLLIAVTAGVFLLRVVYDRQRLLHQKSQLVAAAAESRAQSEKILSVSRMAAPRFVLEAQTYMSEGRWDKARQSVDFALTFDPGLAVAHLLNARLQLGELKLDSAARSFDTAAAKGSMEVAAAARAGTRLIGRIRAIKTDDPTGADYAMRVAAEAAEAREVQVADQLYNRIAEQSMAAGKLDDAARAVIRLLDLRNPRQIQLRAQPPRVVDGKLELVLDDNLFVTNITPLRALPLRLLNLANARDLEDISCLQGLPLADLDLSGTKVRDLMPLRGMPLARLRLAGTQIRDLAPLTGMALRELDIGGARYVNGIEPLTGMPLTALNLKQVPIRDLSPLQGMPLVRLDLEWTPVRRLDPLRGMPLEQLVLDWTRIDDLAPLRGMPLKRLSLANCKEIQRLDAVGTLKQLEYLALPPEPSSVDPLRQLPELKVVCIDGKELPVREFFQRYR